MLVASPDYLASHGKPQHPADLQQHECVTCSLGHSPAEWQFEKAGRAYAVKLNGRLKVNSPDIMGTATVAGLGIAAMMLYSARPYIESGQLKTLMPDYVLPSYEVNGVYPQRQFVPQKVRLLIDYLREYF